MLDDKILFHPLLGNMLLIYNTVTGKVTGRELSVSSQDFPFFNDILSVKRCGIWYEHDETVNLDKMLSYVINQKEKDTFQQKELQAGEIIYNKIMEKLQ